MIEIAGGIILAVVALYIGLAAILSLLDWVDSW